MKRYFSNATQKRWDDKYVFKSTTYPPIPPSDSDIIIISSDSDYLDILAQKYYKDSTLWWIIANANNIGKGRMSVPPGIQLRIPINVSSIIQQFKGINK